jgi:intracellular septation protein A
MEGILTMLGKQRVMVSKNAMLKHFAYGFLPILIFVVSDEFLGTLPALILAVISGIIYAVYYYIKERKIEKMILLDTVLIVIMGGTSILFENDLFFKLKPALVQLIIVVLLAVNAFSDKPILLNMSKKYMGNIKLADTQLKRMKKMSQLLFWIIFIHTLLILWSAFFMNKEAWAFISGGLFYILMALVLAGQWFYARSGKNNLQRLNR